MATEGGPIYPFSTVPTTNEAFQNIHLAASGTFLHMSGLGIAASLAADTIWRLAWKMPPTLPSGTLKLLLGEIDGATSGNARINAKWAGFGEGEVITGALSAETVQTIVSATPADEMIWTRIILDAFGSLVANDILAMDLTFETASWTLAAVSTWFPMLVWE